MRNLTFEEKLIRECKAEPLEGHTVVVLERVGESGERFHSLLEPGGERPRQSLFGSLLGKPVVYFAYAVDASKSRSMSFSEPVEMVERAHGFELHFSLWYRVADPRLLVSSRHGDPLQQVRRKVIEVVAGEIAELPWSQVWHSFRVASASVVSLTFPELKSFARDYGILLTTLRLRATFPDGATETDRQIHELRERRRLDRERIEVAQEEVQIHRRNPGIGNADREEADRTEWVRRVRQDPVARATTGKLGELIAGAGSVDELRDIQATLSGGSDQSPSGRTPVLRGGTGQPTPGGDTLYRVWYATNRRPNGDRSGAGYGARVDDRVHLGSCDVVIPASHKIGELGSPWIHRILTRTDDRLRLRQVVPMEAERFWAGVRLSAASFPAEERHALVFIHGYRVSFQGAALRAAQLGYDLGVKGPVAFFSWPSRATLIGYPADGSAAEASEGAITDFLTQFARGCGADRVHVIAHSMGNRPLLRALQRIVSPAGDEPPVRFGHLVLAAPDVTRQLFLEVADEYRRLSDRTTLYVSHEDRALRASFRLQGPRVGLAPPVTCVPGIDTVHVANVDRTLLGHSTFAEARPVLYDIHALLNYDAPPERRAGLIERRQDDERYWEVRA